MTLYAPYAIICAIVISMSCKRDGCMRRQKVQLRLELLVTCALTMRDYGRKYQTSVGEGSHAGRKVLTTGNVGNGYSI